MKVQEICDKHNISHKNVLKHCQRGRFILDGSSTPPKMFPSRVHEMLNGRLLL
ncbi:hypothetical protein P0136_05665 [Lentisphaerota bacterium ZTH]|nr:hypothetical protein JYG24_03225 [Lentisphaerota bacterium]WET07478.1 hypothetical protein P0136_05665 [Lentisphaerota bacterium ZTH]